MGSFLDITGVYSESSQTSKMELLLFLRNKILFYQAWNFSQIQNNTTFIRLIKSTKSQHNCYVDMKLFIAIKAEY